MTSPALSPSAFLRLPLIADHLRIVQPSSVVEAGCGQGAMAFRLARRYDYRGYEPDPASFRVARERLQNLGRGTVVNTPLPDQPDREFDLLVAFEVLEHLADDVEALRLWGRWVRPGGHVLLSSPAHPHRFGPSDVAVGHFRRYTRPGLEKVMAEAGLSVEAIHCWGMPLGYALEGSRNAYLRRRHRVDSREEATARSGRLFQPPDWLGPVVEAAIVPFALMQRAFRDTDRGIGYVARGRVNR